MAALTVLLINPTKVLVRPVFLAVPLEVDATSAIKVTIKVNNEGQHAVAALQ